MSHFLASWLDWGWAWMLIGLAGHVVFVVVLGSDR